MVAKNKSANRVNFFSLSIFLYLILLGFGPIFQNVGGLATSRLDELLLPSIFLLFILVPILVQGKFVRTPKMFNYTWGGYLAFTLVAICGSVLCQPQYYIRFFVLYLVRLAYLSILFYTVYSYLRKYPNHLHKITTIFIIISLCVSIIGALEWLDILNIKGLLSQYYPRMTTRNSGTRISSIFRGNPTIFGSFMLFPIILIYSDLIVSKQRVNHKVLFLMLIGFFTFTLYLTIAKIAIISLLIIFTFISLVNIGITKMFIHKYKITVISITFFLLVVLLTYYLNADLFIRAKSSLSSSFSGRLLVYKMMLNQFFSNVGSTVFGNGFSKEFAVTESQYFYELIHKGMFGLLGYLIFLLGNFVYFFKVFKDASENSKAKSMYLAITGIIMGIALISAGYNPMQSERVVDWFFILLAVGYSIKNSALEKITIN
jgi:hypothetical protein